ncbi:MAG: hypothetical protein MK105_19535 [Crocinitomicaceae bacterium]|nr:hypothetical protein [Crocinitomicaceae bacterium]
MRKTAKIILLLFLLKTFNSYGQTDTVKYYYHFTETRQFLDKDGVERIEYYVDSRKSSKSEYEKANKECSFDKLINCNGCYLMCYNDRRVLISEGVFKDENLFGKYIRYYDSGELKSIIHYKEYDSTKIFNLDSVGLIDGDKLVYDKKGRLILHETYSNGKLVKKNNVGIKEED